MLVSCPSVGSEHDGQTLSDVSAGQVAESLPVASLSWLGSFEL